MFDVIIIGAGPAGSCLASYLAKEKVNCMVLEKEIFPRPHVGEALTPSCNRVFKDLGLLEKMESTFLNKYGAAWTSYAGKKIFEHDWEGVGEDSSIRTAFGEVDGEHTWHVNRAEFDLILAQRAMELGASVRFGVKVTKATRIACGYEVTLSNKEKLECKILIDASGRDTLIGRLKRWKVKDPVFNQAAMHTWYEGFERTAHEEHYTYIHFLPKKHSWIWQIPISEKITSFGVVTLRDNFVKRKESHGAFFQELLETRPVLAQRLAKAKQVKAFSLEGDYSYSMKTLVDDHLLLIGDAARFIDPIFSSGVSVAMNSARFAAKDILAALKENSFGKEKFKNYESTIRKGTDIWYEFIEYYYRLNVMFTYFIGKKEYRSDIIELLQGDVYNERPKVLDAMKKLIQDTEGNPNHPIYPYLSSFRHQ